jgi:hypothetical protein
MLLFIGFHCGSPAGDHGECIGWTRWEQSRKCFRCNGCVRAARPRGSSLESGATSGVPDLERPSAAPRSCPHFHGGSRGREAVRERKQRRRTLGFDFTRDALRALVAYGWSGNVRELARSCSLFVIHAGPEPGSTRLSSTPASPTSAARAPTRRPVRSSGKVPRWAMPSTPSSAS